jgi:hypothetical protein
VHTRNAFTRNSLSDRHIVQVFNKDEMAARRRAPRGRPLIKNP